MAVNLTPGAGNFGAGGGPSGGGMDPLIISALIQAGTQLFGAGAGAIGQSQSNKARGRQAATMDPFVEMLANVDVSELENIARGMGDMGGEYRAAGERARSSLLSEAEGLRTSDTSGLEAQARRSLRRGSSSLDAMLASRGVYSSGAAQRAQMGLASETLGGLASAINADDLARAQAAAGLVGQAEQMGMSGIQGGLSAQQGMLSGLSSAQQIEMSGLSNALSAIANSPGYGYFDRETGQTRGK